MHPATRTCLMSLCFGLVLLCDRSAFAWDSGLEVAEPKSMDVAIDFEAKGTKLGLKEDLIKAKVELQLRRNGIMANSNPEYTTYLYVSVRTAGSCFVVSVEFYRRVNYFVNGRAHETLARVYSKGIAGTYPDNKGHILQAVADNLDIFISEYLKANQI